MGWLGKFQQKGFHALRRGKKDVGLKKIWYERQEIWRRCSDRVPFIFFLTASMHVSCRTLSLLEWKSARASQSVRDQMLRCGDRKQMEEPAKQICALLDAKKTQKPKTNTHMGKKARLSDRKTWKAGWKVRGEGGLLRASPDKSAADLRQQVLVDRRSQTHGGSIT